MFTSIKKVYSPIDNSFVYYECVLTDGRKMSVTPDTTSPEYEHIQEWIAAGNTVIDNPPE